MPPIRIASALLAAAAGFQVLPAAAAPVPQPPPNACCQTPAFPGQTRAEQSVSGVRYTTTTVTSGLQYPWGIDFLPDGRAIVTEKPGRLRIIAADGTLLPPMRGVPSVRYAGQGGLLDVLVIKGSSPLRICLTYSRLLTDGRSGTTARCSDAVADTSNGAGNLKLTNSRTVWSQGPAYAGGYGHFGSRIVLPPDGKFVITNGERQDVPIRNDAQNPRNGIGKMARVNQDGTTPADNPILYGTKPTKICTLGHRNPQGAAVHPVTGDVWTIEHGPRGGDELNRIQCGKNYGWPVITYGIDYDGRPIGAGITQQAGMEQPVYYWDPVIAPAGMTFYTGSLFPRWQGSLFIGSMGQLKLVRLEITDNKVTGEEHLSFGERIRDVAQAPDGSLWLVTDSSNGRVLRLAPAP